MLSVSAGRTRLRASTLLSQQSSLPRSTSLRDALRLHTVVTFVTVLGLHLSAPKPALLELAELGETVDFFGDKACNTANHNRRHNGALRGWHDVIAAVATTQTVLGDKTNGAMSGCGGRLSVVAVATANRRCSGDAPCHAWSSCRNKAFASGCCCLHGAQHMLNCSSWEVCGAAGCGAHVNRPSDGA